MVQPPTNVPDLSTSADHHLGAVLTIGLPARPASGSARGSRVGVRAHVMRQVVVLDTAGRLRDVVEDLDHAIELALADTPRGVVCDLSAVLEGAEPGAADVLAAVGRHVRDWPGIPVAVACPDPRLRTVLTAHRLSGPLIVTASLFSAVSPVLATRPRPCSGYTSHRTRPRYAHRATLSRAPYWTGAWAGRFAPHDWSSVSS